MYLACIVGSFMVLFAAAESSPYEASRETVQTITFYDNKEDLCNAKMAIKCCICLKMIKTYIPIINALIDKNVRSVCNANKFLKKKCIKLAQKLKTKVLKVYLNPLKSCFKYKMCKVKD
ncbi:hypothetical protein R3I94_011900 [Phoxinus phoxinus]